MPTFKCSECNYSSDVKANLKKHINRKHENATVVEIEVEILCEYCEKSFTTKQNLKKHLKRCFERLANDFHELKDDVKELKQEVIKQQQTQQTQQIVNNTNTNTNSNNIITNNTIIIQNNIQLNSYMKPNLENIMDVLLSNRNFLLLIPKMLKDTNFNRNIPENHNVYISDYKAGVAKAHNGTTWNTVNANDIITHLLSLNDNLLEDLADMSPEFAKHLEKYRELEQNSANFTENQKLEIKNTLYDNRGIVKETIQKIKEQEKLQKRLQAKEAKRQAKEQAKVTS